MTFIASWIVSALGVAAAVWLVPGIQPTGEGFGPILLMALALAFVNAFIKPVAKFLGAPITFLTLGIFLLVINAFMLEIASWLSINVLGGGVVISSFGSAAVGSIIISIVSMFASGFLGDDKK